MDSAIKTLNLKEVNFDPFNGPKLLKAIPTTESQLEIWLSCIIGGNDANRSYNESVSLILDGKLDKEAMIYSLEELIKRHELLHSTFSPDGKSICIYENLPLTLDYQDISHLSQEAKDQHIASIQQTDAEKVFDLQKGPLFRSYLIKLSSSQHFLKLSAHHIICDGWSFGIILENISKIYSAKVNNTTALLEEAIPFSNYSKEELAYLKTEEYKEAESYWINQYNEVPVLNIPTDKPRPSTRTFKSQRLDFQISKEMIDRVKKMGSKSGASLVSTLIASFETYLHLLTKQSTIVLGLPASGQSATGNYELVGHCVNMLPLKSKPTGSLSFTDYLQKRKSEILNDYDHQQFTFGTLLKKLSIARDSSRIPLIPVIFNIDMGMDANVSFSGLKHQLSSDPRSFENFEIFLNITGTGQALTFEWSYNTHLFRVETIKRMMNEFEALLEDVVSNPQIKIKDISIQSTHSIKQLNEWNHTFSKYPKDKIVAEFVNEIAIKNPSKTAIYFEDTELSYTQLNQKSNQLANYLIELGIKKDDIIGLAVDRSPEMIIALLAIMKSGAAYLPLDPQYPKGRIEFMLEDSSAKHLIISEKYHCLFSTKTNQIILENVWACLDKYSNHYPSSSFQGKDLAYILYTSGSTGKPKGVQIEHHSLTNLLLSVQKEPGITDQDKLLAITTISFDIAGTELFLPLITGASIYLVNSDTAKDGRELLQLVQEKEISIMQATPTTWRMMLAAGWTQKLPLKIICTGEAFPKDLAESLVNKGTEVWNGYGPSETTIWSSIKKLIDSDELITIGKPIANTQIYILDDSLNPVSDGVSGELFIAGDGLARNYLNRPELTSEKFINNPFDNGKRKMYRTGDLGYYLDNGEIVCLGRIDAQVKIRGHRIELGEIEYSLSQQAGIKEAVVIPQGENPENQSLIAYIIPDENDSTGWKSRWDDLYTLGIKSEEGKSLEEQNLDIAIISQYNNEEDIKEHGIEWTQEGLKRIRALKAKKILELGTGGGHLLFELAPKADMYIATDYSEVAIAKLNEKLATNPEKWKHVKAYTAAADDFSEIKEKDFDLIFFHGVVQYFPTLDYLVKVLEESVKSVRDGGCIHIADSQTLAGISMHFASEQLNLTNDHATLGDFKKIVNYRVQKEEEISIDPDFFYFIPKIIPEITAVDVQIRKGDYSNEATKCHYDIWLYVGTSTPKIVSSDINITWENNASLSWIEENLYSNSNRVIKISGIPNKRVQKDFVLSQLMETLDDHISIAELKQELASDRPAGINPTQLWELGEQLGFQTHVRWANDGSDGNIEVVFIPSQYKNYIPDLPSKLEIKSEKDYLMVKKEVIDIIDIPEHQIQIWKNTLKEQLPDYMVPLVYVALNHLPTTRNGKVDRNNLPTPIKNESIDIQNSFIAPRNETETLIFGIWSKLLSLDSISINSNFFELGGHSLIAVRVMLSLEKETGIRLPISTLFENSTIEKLAQILNLSKTSSLQNEAEIIEPETLEEITTLTIPAIHPQTEIWVACMLGEDEANKSYNISFSEHFTGNFNRRAMEKALQELVNRHQSLRSTFSVDGTEMLINSYQKLDYYFTDISDLSDDKKNEFVEKQAVQNADTAFDLINGPLFKSSIIKLEENKHLLTITFHHIICDGSSSSILMKELSILYNVYSQNLEPSLEEAPLFSDYAIDKQSFYKSQEYKRIEDFWVDQFKEEVPVLDIPTDYVRPKIRTYKGARVKYPINESIAKQFKKIGYEHGCSSAIAIRTAFEIFLYRITGQETLVSGLPIAGQLTEDKNNLVGHCVNLIPLKAKINKELSFIEYLNKRKFDIFQAYDHHNLTFSSLLNRLTISRDTSRIPLTPVLLNIQSDPYDNQFHNLINKASFNKKLYETFEISINVDDLPTSMSFRWDYNSDLFKAETIEYFHQQFESILNQLCTNPDTLLHEVELLEKTGSKTEINNHMIDRNLNDLLTDSFHRFADHTAINFRDKTISYNDLNIKSNQLANLLISKGVSQGDKVGISLDRSIELIISIIAIAKTGAAYLPLDRTFPSERIGHIINNSSPKCIVTDRSIKNIKTNESIIYYIEDLLEESQDFEKTDPKFDYDENNLIFVLHTSGSTGRPKGVCMGQRAMVNLLTWQSAHSLAGIGTKTLQFSPITFDVSFQEIFSTIVTGGILELITDDQRIDGRLLLEFITSKNIERVFLPFVAFQSLAENAIATQIYPTSLKEIMTAGEQLKITQQIIGLFSKLSNTTLYNQYGPTEAHVVTELKLDGNPMLWPNLPSIGKPINNTQIFILDQNLKEVYPGVPGELCISGLCLSKGYLNLPDINAEKFVDLHNKLNETKRIYRTGDLARFLPDGNIEYLGRLDSQVKIRGFRVELGEIETQLAKIPVIKQTAVKIQDDLNNNKHLIAYFVPNSPKQQGLSFDIFDEWKESLRKELPEYMIPQEFVQLEKLPYTNSGKIDRQALPRVEKFNSHNSKRNIPPKTETERILLEIWENALGVKDIGINNNFFELGGHSLIAVRVMLTIEKQFGVKMPISILFENSTIEKLAKMLTEGERKRKYEALVPIKTTGSKTPIYLVHGGGYNVLTFGPFSKFMDPEQPIFALQGLGLYDKSTLLHNIEEIAKYYISEILENDPIGPYSLGGYSSGGILAFEMARQLIDLDKEVSLLALLDTGVDVPRTEKSMLARINRFGAFHTKKILFYGRSLFYHPRKTLRYFKGKFGKSLESPHLVEINECYNIAFKKYCMKPLNIKVDLFRADTRVYFMEDSEYYGWKNFALKGVNVHHVRGEHNTFILSPYEKEFAKIFQQVIDKNSINIKVS